MDIRRLTSADVPVAKEVWKQCFHDTDAFIDAYFDHAADLRDTLGYFENGRLISDLFMLGFQLNLAGVPHPSPFFAGCATLPEARKRGIMRTLFRNALFLLRGRGVAVSCLHPFLHEFYRRFGYETIAYVDKHWIAVDRRRIRQPVTIANSKKELPVQKLLRGYERYAGQFDNYFIRDEKRFDCWLDLLFADGGMISYIDMGDHAAYALYYRDKADTDVFELVSFDENQRLSLLHSCPGVRAKFFTPGEIQFSKTEFTMMRILNPAAVLRRYRYAADVSFVIHVTDAFLELEHRLAVEVKGGRAAVRSVRAASDFEMEVTPLAALIAGAYDPQKPSALHRIFPRKSSCFFETY